MLKKLSKIWLSIVAISIVCLLFYVSFNDRLFGTIIGLIVIAVFTVASVEILRNE